MKYAALLMNVSEALGIVGPEHLRLGRQQRLQRRARQRNHPGAHVHFGGIVEPAARRRRHDLSFGRGDHNQAAAAGRRHPPVVASRTSGTGMARAVNATASLK